MPPTKNKFAGLKKQAKSQTEVVRLTAAQTANEHRIQELEPEQAQQAARIAALEAAAVAATATALKAKEQAVNAQKSRAASAAAAKDEEIKELKSALSARSLSVHQLEHTVTQRTNEAQGAGREAAGVAQRLANAEQQVADCKCGKGTWNEPTEGAGGKSHRCNQRRALRISGAAFFINKDSYQKRVAEEATNNEMSLARCPAAGAQAPLAEGPKV